MHTTSPGPDEQRLRASLDGLGVLELIERERFAAVLAEHCPRFRHRLYTPARTLAMFVAQTLSDDASCRRAVNDLIADRVARGEPAPSSHTGAYCDARQRLPTALVRALCDEIARAARRSCTLDARPTLLIDGTGFSMPDTDDNQEQYPQSSSQAPGCGFPQGRLVALACAVSGAIVDTTVSGALGKDTGETSALRALVARCEPGTLLIGDAIYENYRSWAALERAGCDAVFEINGSRRFRDLPPKRLQLKRPGRRDPMTVEEHAALPARLELRVVISSRPGCEDRFLVTSLLDDKAWPDEAIVALFAKRWDVESDFRSFKDTLGAGILGCRTPQMIEKELAVHVLGYNMVRLLMCEAAAAAGIEPREVSFRHAQQCWIAWTLARVELDEANWTVLLERVAQHRVRNRPGRREPRATKRRPKSRALLDLRRDSARIVWELYERKGR